MSAYVENPEAVGDPNQTPRVRLWPAGEPVSSERFNKLDADLAAATARAERAEAAIQRVGELRQRYGALNVPVDSPFNAGRLATLMDVLDDLDAALDSTDPEPAPKEQSNG